MDSLKNGFNFSGKSTVTKPFTHKNTRDSSGKMYRTLQVSKFHSTAAHVRQFFPSWNAGSQGMAQKRMGNTEIIFQYPGFCKRVALTIVQQCQRR